MKNNRRYDLSERLIHFFRNLDLDDGTAPHLPEEWGWSNIAEPPKFSAMFLMRCAIRHGRIWATWAMRSRVRTIYGPNPAICFTDMPTAAFLEASFERQKAGQKISSMALTFSKKHMFDLGARPVIYGLTEDNVSIPSGGGGGPRIIPVSAMPYGEQYRYVAYYPTGSRRVDWTHEREWRWRYNGSLKEFESEIVQHGQVNGVRDIPGLDIYNQTLNNIGVIVNTDEEAKMVLHDVLVLVDRRQISPTTYDYVFVSDKIPSPATIRDPDSEQEAIANATIDLTEFITPKPQRDHRLAQRVKAISLEVEASAGDPKVGEPGGCWLWLVDNVHVLTRALLNCGNVVINREGKYLMPLHLSNGERALRQREEITTELAQRLGKEFGIESGYYSVLASNDPNGLPFYNDNHINNERHYNLSCYGLS